jgi:hypothetical protein
MYVNTKTAGDIAITAAEGGIGYWSVIDEYKPSRWTVSEGYYSANLKVSRDFVFYTVREDAGNGLLTDPGLVVTPKVIQRGVDLFLAGVPDNFEARFFADRDLSMMDAAEADSVVQLGLFGKLVYG